MARTDQPTTVNADCPHPKATHYHGTVITYARDACRCIECRAASQRYKRHWKRLNEGLDPDFYLGEYWQPGSPEWLTAMRAGLAQAVAESIERHGRVAI